MSTNKLNQQQEQETLMKIITLGSSGAGKTSLLLRMTHNQFNENYMATIGVDFSIKRTYVDNKSVKMQIWDTAGQERFRTAISGAYYRGASGIFFVFDITSEDSFHDVQKIYERTMEEIKNMNQNIQCVLIGCKNDLESRRVISYDVAMAFAESLGMHYIETSAKQGTNCLEAADHIARLCYGQIKNQKVEDKPMLVEPKLDMQKKTTCC